MPEDSTSRRCPRCGNGVLVEISYREDPPEDVEEPIQTADTRQVETYSCGHEVIGPRLDRTATPEGGVEAERRTSEETAEPT